MRGRLQRTDENCAATVADADLDSSYVCDAQGRMQSESNDNVSRSFTYDSYSRVSGVSVTIDSLTRTSGFSFDDHHRPTAVTYPGGEVITTTYGSPGVAVGLSSSVHGALVDSVNYDEAGRMTAMRFPAGGNLWRTQSYHPWTEPKNGGMLASLKVGLSEGGGERLSRGYAYNSFGDITALTEGATSNSFTYDGLGRLTSAYGRSYSYDGASRLTSFNGQAYGDSGPFHAVDRIGNADRFDYDANGNMNVRNKGLAGQQTLVWDAQNRLSQVQDNNGDLLEQYWYGVKGTRVKKTSGTTTTYIFFAYYEEEAADGVVTTVSHYSFGGLRIAVKRGSDLYHLYGGHLGSISLTTDGAGAATASRAYYAYGAERSSSGDFKTDHTFTGQKRDSTGLMYYNARYYDPALGVLTSPDSMIPNSAGIIGHNRFLYARANPLKYADPSGHIPKKPKPPLSDGQLAIERYWQDRWHGARGFAYDPFTGGYTRTITPFFTDMQAYEEMLNDAGITVENLNGWNFEDELEYLGQGIAILARRVAGSSGRLKASFAHLKDLIGGGVTWYRAASYQVDFPCNWGAACAMEAGRIGFYESLFDNTGLSDDQYRERLRGTAIHEFAHKIHLAQSPCPTDHGVWCITKEWFTDLNISKADWEVIPRVSKYGEWGVWENWAEGVAVWVYPSYKSPQHLTDEQKTDIRELLQPWP